MTEWIRIGEPGAAGDKMQILCHTSKRRPAFFHYTENKWGKVLLVTLLWTSYSVLILVWDNYQESTASWPISKLSKTSIIGFSFSFLFLFQFFSQVILVIFFFLCYFSRDLRNKKLWLNVESKYEEESTASRPLNKVNSCLAGFLLAWVTHLFSTDVQAL